MLKACCLSLLLLMCLHGSVGAQNNETDSLIRLLNKSPEDTSKVNLYWETGASIIYQNALEAIPYFKKGFLLAKKLRFDAGAERCYAGTSLAHSFNAKYDSALVYIDTAVYYAVKVGNKRRLALVYLNRADVYSNLQNFSAALKNCDTAIKYAEQSNNKSGLARIYSIMVTVYTAQKQYPQAFATLDKAEALFEEVKNIQMLGMTHSDRALLYVEINEPDKAIPLYKKAIHIADSIQDIENLSSYTNGLAGAYMAKKMFNEAESMAKLALNYAQQTGNRTQESEVLQSFYQVSMGQNNYAKAIEYGLKAYTILKEEKDLMREQICAANLAEAYFKSGNTLQAYNYLKISRELNDSLLKQQFSNETAKLQTTFQVSQKDKEILLLNKDKELQQQKLLEQRLMMFGAAAIALLALAGIWLLVNRNKLRQHMKELELRNRIAADLHDEVGSSLSSIHMLSQMATQQDGNAKQKDILARMSSNAKETMDKMGDIVWMIKPGETEAGSLKQRMERFAYEISSSKNIEVSIQLDELEKVKLTMDQRKNIYLIFKEALNNAVKYSGTEKISIVTTVQNKELQLLVEDHGKGFDSSLVKKGNGLDNMYNRAKELGAVLQIDSDEEGTDVVLTMPL